MLLVAAFALPVLTVAEEEFPYPQLHSEVKS